MAGHNKWSKIKRLKGALHQKRGKLFSKLAKEIAVAARSGGGDPAGNARLRTAILAARAQSMPADNIDRAIRRGTGESSDGGQLEEMIYEGCAPGGAAVLLEVATDNKNRTAADLRHIFSKNHGNLASSGSVAYLFKHQGQIAVPRAKVDEDRILELALEAGADDVAGDDENHLIVTPPDRLNAVAENFRTAGVTADSQKLTYTPETTVVLTDEHIAAQVLRLCDLLDDNDDVQNVHANFDLPEDLLTRLSA